MLCLTGGEDRSGALAARLRAHGDELLQEVRLDLLQDLDDGVFPLLRGPQIVATCRAATEGGRFRGTEAERHAVLRRALREQPGYLDVELAVPGAVWRELDGARGATRLLGSQHVMTPHPDLAAVSRALEAVPAQLLKVAVVVEDATDLLALLALSADWPLLRVGMGPAGLLSRALPSRFGSPWSYVHADDAPATAPGQLSLARARAWRIDEPALAPLVLVGGEQVLGSPGPEVYNRLFARHGLPYLYLPVISRRPAALLELLARTGVRGASVTMPLKESLLPLVDRLTAPADRIGAVNTLRLGPPLEGWNSDGPAVAALAGAGAGRLALVLGAGGAARAAALALREGGWSVRVCARSLERAAALARAVGVAPVPWPERGRGREELVLNATPCGSDGSSDPILDRQDWEDALVLDMVLAGEGALTPLLRRAAAGGARVISGLELWLEQGARQMSWLTGETVSADELRSCLP